MLEERSSPPPKFAPFPPLFATLTLRCDGGGVGFSGPLGYSRSAIGGHPVCLIAVRVRCPPLVYCSEGGKTPSPPTERTMVHSGLVAPLGHKTPAYACRRVLMHPVDPPDAWRGDPMRLGQAKLIVCFSYHTTAETSINQHKNKQNGTFPTKWPKCRLRAHGGSMST